MKKRQTRPQKGTTMFCVQEHLYYTPGRAGPAKEYVVFEGKVAGFYDGPGWVDIQLQGRGADGTETVHRRLMDIGTKVFFTAREAAELARDMTEDYEKRWAWTERWGDVPLRRPWEHLFRVEPERAAPKAAGRQPPALVADHYQLTMFDIMAAPKEATA